MLPSVADAAYRLLYHGLLRRLPESRAVRVGQAMLRALPIERLPGFSLDDPRLAVRLAGVRLRLPVILSSMYYDATVLRKAMALGFGAVTTKSITESPRPGHPEPNLVRIVTAEGPGFVNCNGFHNPGLASFRVTLASLPRRCPVIVSVAGESPAEYRTLVEALAPHADLVELNVSSPNTRLVYELSTSPEKIRALFRDVRRATPKPILVKLSPDYPAQNRASLVPAVLDEGLDGVNFGNTRRVEHGGLSQGAGGLSGPALYEGVLGAIRELRALLGPGAALVATGGIDTPDKALAALQAGADAVSYFTAFITRGPVLPRRIGERLLAALQARGLSSVAELTGRA